MANRSRSIGITKHLSVNVINCICDRAIYLFLFVSKLFLDDKRVFGETYCTCGTTEFIKKTANSKGVIFRITKRTFPREDR